MIRLKTSILFGSAAYGGALIGGKEVEEANELRQMAIWVGLGFQIWDDYLDATASAELFLWNLNDIGDTILVIKWV